MSQATIPKTLHAITPLILKTTPWSKYCYLCFTDEKNEAPKFKTTCPHLHR